MKKEKICLNCDCYIWNDPHSVDTRTAKMLWVESILLEAKTTIACHQHTSPAHMPINDWAWCRWTLLHNVKLSINIIFESIGLPLNKTALMDVTRWRSFKATNKPTEWVSCICCVYFYRTNIRRINLLYDYVCEIYYILYVNVTFNCSVFCICMKA